MNKWAGFLSQMLAEEFYILEQKGLLAINVKSGFCIGDSVGRVIAAMCLDEEYAELFKGRLIKLSDLTRKTKREKW